MVIAGHPIVSTGPWEIVTRPSAISVMSPLPEWTSPVACVACPPPFMAGTEAVELGCGVPAFPDPSGPAPASPPWPHAATAKVPKITNEVEIFFTVITIHLESASKAPKSSVGSIAWRAARGSAAIDEAVQKRLASRL